MKRLIVARFDEDMSWADSVPEGWKVCVVQKGRDLPNHGREAASFLWWIHEHYADLTDSDRLAFVQGRGLDHCNDLMRRLEEPIEGYRPLGDEFFDCQGDGNPHHGGLPVAEKYEAWLKKPFPGTVEFPAGGQFAITGRELTRHPRSFYKRLLEESKEGENAWVFERLWGSLLG